MKKIALPFIMILVTLFPILLMETFTEQDEDPSNFYSLEALHDQADLVILGNIEGYKNIMIQREDQITFDRLYDVEVVDVIVNRTELNIRNNSFITLMFYMGSNANEEYSSVFEQDENVLKDGHYLLFLNDFKDPFLNDIVFVTSSPNHLYKKVGYSFINVYGKGKREISLPEIQIMKMKNNKQ